MTRVFKGNTFTQGFGRVTTYTDVTHFSSEDFIGLEDDSLVGYTVWCIWDAGGAGAAPQGEFRGVIGNTSSTGQIEHVAFSAALAAEDKVVLLSPVEYAAMTIAGGPATIQDVLDNQADLLDLAEYPVNTLLMDGTEQTLYEVTGASVPYLTAGLMIDWTGLNSGAGEDTTIRAYLKIDGTNYVMIYTETFLAAGLPSPLGTAHPITPGTQKPTPDTLYTKQDFKITAQQAAPGGGYNTLSYRAVDAMR